MNLNVKLNLLIIGQRWRSTPEEMSNARWGSSRFCTGTSTISYLHLCEKNKHTPFWNSADEQNLKLLTFQQSHVYSTSGFFYTTKFSQIWCVVFRNNLKKNCFQLILIFHYFYRWRSAKCNTWWCSARFCTGTYNFLFTCEKTNTPMEL